MKPPQRKRVVRETFETWVRAVEDVKHAKARIIPLGAYTDKFKPGDRVRVKVTKLERGK